MNYDSDDEPLISQIQNNKKRKNISNDDYNSDDYDSDDEPLISQIKKSRKRDDEEVFDDFVMDILEDDKTMIEEIKELDYFFIHDAPRFTDKMSNTKYFRGMKTPYYMDNDRTEPIKNVGDSFIIKGYLSISSHKQIAKRFMNDNENCCLYEIYIDKGVPFVDMMLHTHYHRENELLLPRNLRGILLEKPKEVNGLLTYKIKVELLYPQQFSSKQNICKKFTIASIKSLLSEKDLYRGGNIYVKKLKNIVNKTKKRIKKGKNMISKLSKRVKKQIKKITNKNKKTNKTNKKINKNINNKTKSIKGGTNINVNQIMQQNIYDPISLTNYSFNEWIAIDKDNMIFKINDKYIGLNKNYFEEYKEKNIEVECYIFNNELILDRTYKNNKYVNLYYFTGERLMIPYNEIKNTMKSKQNTIVFELTDTNREILTVNYNKLSMLYLKPSKVRTKEWNMNIIPEKTILKSQRNPFEFESILSSEKIKTLLNEYSKKWYDIVNAYVRNSYEFVNWKIPSIQELKKEFKIEHELKGNDFFENEKNFIDAVLNGDVITITPELNKEIKYRSNTKNKKELLDLIKTYKSYPRYRNEETIENLYNRFKNNKVIDMPIIIEFLSGERRILSGNTRMDIAFHLNINPKVLVIYSEQMYSESESEGDSDYNYETDSEYEYDYESESE